MEFPGITLKYPEVFYSYYTTGIDRLSPFYIYSITAVKQLFPHQPPPISLKANTTKRVLRYKEEYKPEVV